MMPERLSAGANKQSYCAQHNYPTGMFKRDSVKTGKPGDKIKENLTFRSYQ
jgi:hypothetical protein